MLVNLHQTYNPSFTQYFLLRLLLLPLLLPFSYFSSTYIFSFLLLLPSFSSFLFSLLLLLFSFYLSQYAVNIILQEVCCKSSLTMVCHLHFVTYSTVSSVNYLSYLPL
jgi:hypothetical protein